MTIQEALTYGRSQLSHSPTPHLDARLLLAHVLQAPHSALISHGDDPLTAAQAGAYHALIARARQHEPIPYLTGQAPFFDFQLHVSPAVLIPRPETEQLVELAISLGRARPAAHIVDVGTGSGCIAIALARHLAGARLSAVDCSAAALAVARQNAGRLAPGRIHFFEGDLLAPIDGPVDVMAANLPYVTDDEWTLLDDGVKWFEPSLALKGGADGLDLVRRLLRQATTKLSTSGVILLEIGWQQGAAAQALARAHFPEAAVTVRPDLAGHDRLVIIEQTDSTR